MPFILFQLLFAAVAIALAIVLFLIMRRLRNDREPPALILREPKPASRPRLPALGRKAAEPPPAPAPPPARKRQLRSLSEVERDTAAQDDGPGDAPPPAAEEDFGQGVLARLEAAFEQLEAGAVSLDGYAALVRAEQAHVDRRIAALQPGGPSALLDDALTARDSVRWCLAWADEQRQDDPGSE
jgi:hypothetical protein